MELIEGHPLPKSGQLLSRILATTHPVERLQVLILIQNILTLAVEFLYLGHITVAAFENISHLALVSGSLNGFFLSHLEEGFGCSETNAGIVWPGIQFMCPFNIQSCRTSSMITLACRAERAMPIDRKSLQTVTQSFVDVSIIASCAECQHTRPIGTFPPECTRMRGSAHQSEIVHSALAQHLRQLRLVTEVIRQPTHSCHTAKARLEITLPQEERACESLARRHLLVTFHPHAANWFEAPFLDIFLHFTEEFRVLLLDHLIHNGFALQQMVVGILLHESHGLTEIVVSHLLCLRKCPEPVHIHMGMPDDMQRVLCHVGILLNGLRGKRQTKPHQQRNDRESRFHVCPSYIFYFFVCEYFLMRL